MSRPLDLPISLERLTPEERAWIAAKAGRTGKSPAEVVLQALRKSIVRVKGRRANPKLRRR